MITWLVGENSFDMRETLRELEAAFDGPVERVDGTELTLSNLPDLLMGVSLFSPQRFVSISNLSQNSAVWEKLPEWLPRINDDIHIVFIDAKPDKRTSSYKALKAAADIKEFPAWSERDTAKAEQWVVARAAKLGVAIDRRAVQQLVSRVGLDQWQLAQALDALSLLDEITIEAIDSVVPPNLKENIFQLFETALEGKSQKASDMLRTLALQEDPYALLALLNSQALSLAAVTYANEHADPVKDFAIHPFVASKLTRHGKRLGKGAVGHILEACARTDADMKRSKADPWVLIDKLILEIAHH